MPNVRGGKSFKRNKKNAGTTKKSDMPIAENDDQRYANVIRKLGGNRLALQCSDTELRQGLIPGSFYKKVWINPGDILLVEISPFNNKECHIIHKYEITDARSLRSKGLLTFDGDSAANKGDNIFADELTDSDDDIYEQIDKVKIKTKQPVDDTSLLSDEDVDDGIVKPMSVKEKEKLARKINKKEKDIKRSEARDNKEFDFDSI